MESAAGWGIRSESLCRENWHLIVQMGPRGNSIYICCSPANTPTHAHAHTQWWSQVWSGYSGPLCVWSSDPTAHSQWEDKNRGSPLPFPHPIFTSVAGRGTSGHIKTHTSQRVRVSALCLALIKQCKMIQTSLARLSISLYLEIKLHPIHHYNCVIIIK